MEIREYVTQDGRAVYTEWLNKVRDRQARVKIRTQIDRLEQGNTGDCKALGSGLHELRIHYGPGYQIYFGHTGKHIILLLCAGNKATRQRDIKRARHYWNDYRSRTWNQADPTRNT
ncbi:MAG: type II toxin-antitoxin system RelE/ParE family toxin [Gammaproteobacteria bacterium]|nr:type II toxin-antitoxin system RelE/ParE family toxin [Gammaproteobacteria bacterium]